MTTADRPQFGHTQKDGVFVNLSQFRPTELPLAQGEVSNVSLLKDSKGNLYVKKTLRENGAVLTRIIDNLSTIEYDAVGYIGTGGSLEGRSLQEQAVHMKRAALLGHPMVLPVYADDQTLVTPFIRGETLRKHLYRGETAAIQPALTSLHDAHSRDILHGDRWTPNIIVQDTGEIRHIDFDFALVGGKAKELELAQLLYIISGDTTHLAETSKLFAQFAETNADQYDWEQVNNFLKGYEAYLTRHTYGKTSKKLVARLGNKLEVITSAIKPG